MYFSLTQQLGTARDSTAVPNYFCLKKYMHKYVWIHTSRKVLMNSLQFFYSLTFTTSPEAERTSTRTQPGCRKRVAQ